MKRRPILIALAVLLALVGTGAVYVYVHTADSRAVNGMKATSVLVVTKEIPVGTPWSAVAAGGYVTTESFPASAAPSSALTSTTAAGVEAASVATHAIPSGQILVREMFAQKPPSTGAVSIPGKLQALTVSVPTSADVSGYVQNGSDVAVYSVLQLQRPGTSGQQISSNPMVSRLLIPRVGVLAVSQAAPTSLNGGGSAPAGSVLVTLAVTQQQAERIILAQKLGDLYLALLTDTSVTAEDGGTIGAGIFNPSLLFTR